LIAPDGVGVIQAHYLGYIFDTLGYGDIYHEHMSYYAIRPLIRFYESLGLEIFDYEMLPFQGVSIRVYFGHTGAHPVHPRVQELANEELAKGWDKLETYQQLASDVEKSKDKLLATLTDLKAQGKHIAAYGAAAKGVPILNYAGINTDIIDFCVDGLPKTGSLHANVAYSDYLTRGCPHASCRLLLASCVELPRSHRGERESIHRSRRQIHHADRGH
jgi:hypothetical protein